MLNRYNILKSEGKNDNEITGIIISEFNNISELINEQINIHNMNNFSNNVVTNPIKYKRREKIIRAVLSSYWPVVTAFYFAISFLFHNWNVSWIIFLIAPAVKKFLHSYYYE